MVSRTVGQVDLRVKTRLSDEGDSCTRLEVGNPDLEVVFVAQQVESNNGAEWASHSAEQLFGSNGIALPT